jgi:glycerol-3-phosphate cytidylyltransferase
MTEYNSGITFSSFDLFHSGHVAMLKEASENCDY